MATILAVDPGSHKCGLAVVREDGTVVERQLVPTQAMRSAVEAAVQRHEVTCVVLGDSTTSSGMRESLGKWLPEQPVDVVNEHGSTLEARRLYWQFHPRRGWRRFVPLALQVPPEPVDDFAAVVLAQRYLQTRL